MNEFLRKFYTIRFVAPWSIFRNFLEFLFFLIQIWILNLDRFRSNRNRTEPVPTGLPCSSSAYPSSLPPATDSYFVRPLIIPISRFLRTSSLSPSTVLQVRFHHGIALKHVFCWHESYPSSSSPPSDANRNRRATSSGKIRSRQDPNPTMILYRLGPNQRFPIPIYRLRSQSNTMYQEN